MADEFVTIPITTDPDVLFQELVDRIRQQWPDWNPEPGNLETVLVLGWAYMQSSLAVLAASVPEAILQQAGKTLFALPPQAASNAQVESTWTAIDNKGYTIEAGTQVVIAAAGDDLKAFEVRFEVEIAPGDTVTDAGEVQLIALLPGADSNDLTEDPNPVDALDWISSIKLEDATAGGADAETSEEYSTRLRQELRLLSPRPIIPSDFEILALQIPEVARALAIDGWDPEAETDENERMISVAVIDESGNALSGAIKEEVDALLQAKREVNFEVFVIDPDVTKIDASATVYPLPGYSDATVKANVEAALEKFLDPENFGLPIAADPGTGGGWRRVTKLRLNDVIAVIENTEGVDFSELVKIAKDGSAVEAKDVDLAGAAPLTEPDTITVTVA